MLNPMQWLAVDVVNNFGNGVDKTLFSERIQWVKDNLTELKNLKDKADKPHSYMDAVRALEDSLAGKPTTHLVGLDSSQSGIQIMSALTRDRKGCEVTNASMSKKYHDAYTRGMEIFNELSGEDVRIDRDTIKGAIMPFFYGSTGEPKKIFGEGKDLDTFFKALDVMAEGANWLRKVLISAWDTNATEYSWTLPDGYEVKTPVLSKASETMVATRLEGTVTMINTQQVPLEWGVSLAGNTIHSVDAYVMRSMVRRLCYDKTELTKAKSALMSGFIAKRLGATAELELCPELIRLVALYNETKMPDTRIFQFLTDANARVLDERHIAELLRITQRMESHEPIQMYTIHDDFRCHANDANRVAEEYREILAELSDSNTLEYLLAQLGVEYRNNEPYIGHLIRASTHALG